MMILNFFKSIYNFLRSFFLRKKHIKNKDDNTIVPNRLDISNDTVKHCNDDFELLDIDYSKNGRGTVFRVKNTRKSDDYDWLNGNTVVINDGTYIVLNTISDKPRNHEVGDEICLRVSKVKRRWS